MLYKKIIVAGIAAALASASMVSYASNSPIITTANNFSAEVENTVVSAEVPVVATATADAASAAEEGAALRESLHVKVSDVVSFDYDEDVEYASGTSETVYSNEDVWIIGIDDVNQRFRIYVPRLCSKSRGLVLYMEYSTTFDAYVKNHNGYAVGDIDRNQHVDVFDLAMSKHILLGGGKGVVDSILADVDNDGKVTVIDVVKLQRWIHGLPDETTK